MNIENSQIIDETISGIKTIKNKEIEEYKDTVSEAKSLNIEKKENIFEKVIKRTVDILGSIVGIIFLIPLTIAIFIANKLTRNYGPVFYIQERIGKDGKIFKMYKYRSMVVGADDKLEKHLKENENARREYKINKKLKYDPRITKVGNFIRKTSIDEFPQFINILKGQMSLVGPRPYLPKEKEEMDGYYQYIIKKKPGLTGLWQVSGRNDVTFKERLILDMKYYNKSNLLLDAKILIKTFIKVLKKEGAV